MSALLKVAELKAMRVVVTDVVLEESVHQRLAAAEAASTGLRTALAKAAKVFKDEDLGFYIPDPANAATGWRGELVQIFEIWPTDGEDAREALFREASRRAPARAAENGSAIGSRDASIWLSVVRIAGESTVDDVIFVSSNTKDFAGSDAGI
ncbi:PIN domain-containing protein, partial [Promicromonospora sp. NPDC060204]|uniref:PIN domain-containing protein n=1 Tax=Promicromonospora sp. NPDC060204 TaxID=3347071 RepID=UPI003653F0AD